MIGREISHYSITTELGVGGMGVVYQARDRKLQRDVAIKMLTAERALRPVARKRFHREAIAASALNHPNIVTIYEIAEQDGADFIVMEFVRGTPLNKLLRERPLTVEETVRYGTQVADALAKAHQAGVVHRDLKPGNIMVTDDGVVKVLDFGLAKFDESMTDTEDPDATQVASFLTSPGVVTGTMSYMSPEQARGEKVDARSDIFSLGIVLFELLSQRLPFEGPTLVSMLHNLHFVPPQDLNSLRGDVPRPLLTLISLMLEKEPAHRIQTMTEVAAALRRFAAGQDIGLKARPRGTPPGTTAEPSRSRWLVGGLAAALLLAAGLGVWGYIRTHNATQLVTNAALSDDPVVLRNSAAALLGHYYRADKLSQAIQLLERSVQLDPNSAAGHAALAEAYIHRNRANPDPQWLKLARQEATRANELDSDLAASHYALGMVAVDAKDPVQAEAEFQRANTLDPKNPMSRVGLAALHASQGKTQDSIQELGKVLADHPDSWQAYMELGLQHYNAARYQDAATAWQKAAELAPDNVDAFQNLGGVYHALDRDDDAAEALQKALAIEPAADTYSNLGTIRFYQGRYRDAVSAFEKTVALSANSAVNWGNLADAYRWRRDAGDEAKSKQAYQRAIQILREELKKSPDQAESRATMAMYLAKSGDKAAAQQELRTLASAKAPGPSVLYYEAVALELCGDRDHALTALSAALQAGWSVADLKNEPELTALRADPRYHLQVLALASNSATPTPH